MLQFFSSNFLRFETLISNFLEKFLCNFFIFKKLSACIFCFFYLYTKVFIFFVLLVCINFSRASLYNFCSILFQNFVLLYFCVLFFYKFFIYFVPFSLDKVLPVVVLFKIVFDGIIYCWRFVLGAARYHETTANLCDAEKQTTHPTIMQNGTKKWLSEIGDRPYTAEFPGDRKLARPLAVTRTPCGEHDRPKGFEIGDFGN